MRRVLALLTAITVFAAVFVSGVNAAQASSGPFTPSVVTTTSTTNVICRAYGGALSANTEADQALSYSVTAPNAVQPGQTYDIKIKQPFSAYPRTNTSTGTTANIVAIYNQIVKWALPSDVTINSVSLAPINGDVEANADAGYYVAPANVPTVTVPGVGTIPDPAFDPMTLPPSQRVAIPGTAPAAYIDPATSTVRLGMLGTGTESGGSVYAAGSIVQAPALTVSVTAKPTVTAGTELGIKLAGQLPAGSLTGSQPSNFPAPNTITVDRSNSTSSDTTWTNPSYVNYVHTTALGGLITVIAKAACGPGWEATPEFPTAPAYYTGPDAIPNGTAPLLNSTKVIGISSATPFEGASYITGSNPGPISYACIANPLGEPYDTCVGDQPNGATLDTSTPGPKTFTINATDAFQAPISRTIHYTVADPVAPNANAGAPQTGRVAGNVVTLNASGTTDPNGPPTLPLTYSWTQTSGPAVTLSNPNAINPTFTVPPVNNPAGYTFGFDVTVNNGYLSNTSSTTVSAVPATPTVTVSRAPSGTVFTGDVVTLTANITNPDGNSPADYTYAWTQASGRTTSLSSNSAANPSFSVPTSGASATAVCTSGTGATGPTSANCPRFSVTVTNIHTGASSTVASLAAYGSTLPTRPTANAGANQNLPNAGGLVTLNGSGAQAQNHAISYAWTQTSGDPVTLSDPTVAQPTFTAPVGPATLGFELVVTDTQNPITTGTNQRTSLPSSTTVSVVPDTVVANAGPDQTGRVAGQTVTLDGTGSTEPTLAPLTYSWVQVDNGAPTVTLVNPTSAQPTFVALPVTTPGGYTVEFELTATNGGAEPADTDTDTVSVSVVRSTPTVTVSRAPSGTVFTGDVVTLSANITNPDGASSADYTYTWSQASGRTTSLSSTSAVNPTFSVPTSGSSATAVCTSGTGTTSPTSANCPRFQVTVTNIHTGASSTVAALAAYGSTLPTRPTANAGANQTFPNIAAGNVATLSGSGAQAQNHAISFAWTQTSGPAVVLSDPTAAQPTFTIPVGPATLTFELVVTDTQNPITTGTNQRTSLVSSTTVSVVADTVVANAGPDQTGRVAGQTVTLDGTGSTEPTLAPLTYSWVQVDNGAPTVTLVNPTSAQPTFVAPVVTSPGGYTVEFELTATNGGAEPGDTDTDTVSVSVVRSTPAVTVSRAPSGTVFTGDVVTLNASITNPDGTNPADYTYTWTQASGRTTTLSSTTAANPTFSVPTSGSSATAVCTSGTGATSPTSANCPRFSVTVTNNATGASSTVASLAAYGSTLPTRPTANAGAAQSVKVGSLVTLNGSGAQAQNHAISYAWTQTDGPAVVLSDAAAATPSFTAPVDGASLTFSLVVTDTQNPITTGANQRTSLASTVVITVQPYAAPVASAGSDQTAYVGAPVTLDATGSSQEDGNPLTYEWTQTSGEVVTLSSITAAQPTFAAPASAGALTFTVTVTDPINPNAATNSATSSEVTVTVVDYPTISGTVTDSDEAPVEGAVVSAFAPTDGLTATATAVTDASGAYTLIVPAGTYALFISAPAEAGLHDEWFDDQASRAAATAVVVAVGSSASGVDAVLAPVIEPNSISGTVLDSEGDPLEGVVVVGVNIGTAFVATTTAADGTYLLADLAAGTYLVAFLPPGATGLATQFFDQVATPAEATPLVLTEGSEFTGVDAALVMGPSISGTVTGSGGSPLSGVTVEAWLPGAYVPSYTAVTGADGSYLLVGLAANSYQLRFNPAPGSGLVSEFYDNVQLRGSAALVNVGTGPVVGVNAELAMSSSISGTVTAGGEPAAGVSVEVWKPGAYLPTYTATTSASGTYSIPNAAPASYQVRFVPTVESGLTAKWYVDSLTRSGATTVVVNGGVSVVDGSLLAPSSISGVVTDGGGNPVAGVLVQAFKPGDTFVSSYQTTTAANGTYTLNNVGPNTYQLRFGPPSGSGLAVQWYNAVPTKALATPVVVGTSQIITGRNAVLVAL